MSHNTITERDIIDILQPETDIELTLVSHPEVIQGLLWGEPRYGHPEGKVLFHIPEIFDNIDRITPPLSIAVREKLRLITLLHDTFKYVEDKNSPRDWSRHHSILARLFSENYIDDGIVLDIIELHDEAYYCWRLEVLEDEPEQASARLNMLLDRIGDFLQIYYFFFKCDTATGDKTQAPVKWFEKKISNKGNVKLFSFKK
jgi:hypothetical protein